MVMMDFNNEKEIGRLLKSACKRLQTGGAFSWAQGGAAPASYPRGWQCCVKLRSFTGGADKAGTDSCRRGNFGGYRLWRLVIAECSPCSGSVAHLPGPPSASSVPLWASRT